MRTNKTTHRALAGAIVAALLLGACGTPVAEDEAAASPSLGAEAAIEQARLNQAVDSHKLRAQERAEEIQRLRAAQMVDAYRLRHQQEEAQLREIERLRAEAAVEEWERRHSAEPSPEQEMRTVIVPTATRTTEDGVVEVYDPTQQEWIEQP